jgi:hypothetical protein
MFCDFEASGAALAFLRRAAQSPSISDRDPKWMSGLAAITLEGDGRRKALTLSAVTL